MNRRIIIIATLVIAICNIGRAEDKVTISDFKISAGETKSVSVTLDNDAAYASFQFDLYLPEGITVEAYSADRRRMPESTTLSMSKQDDGSYRFIAVATKAMSLTGSSGSIISLTMKASEGLSYGEKTGYFRKVKLSKSDATGPTYAEMSFPITVVEPSTVTAMSYSREYGQENPEFEYEVEGGTLEGTPEISCEATKTSPVDTYPIVITKGTVTNYNVTYVNGTLTVTKAPLTITAKDYTIKQGEALPVFEATCEGFRNDETSEVLTKQPTITTTATSASNPGEYDIAVSGAESQNYEINYVKGKLTIIEADPVTITANSYTIEYGDDIPAFEYTIDGAELEGTPEITCAATQTSPVGTYTIVIKKGTVTNYNDTYVNGTLTITKAPLKITAKDYTIKKGDALPTFEATYEGFKNDETEAVLTKQPVFTTTATASSEPGEYEISVSGAEAQNYEVIYVSGKLTIEKPAFIPGDVNGDGLVNVTDIVATVNYIMEKPSDGFNKEAADLSGDGDINVTDIVKMVSIIMSGNGGSSRRASATSSHLVINRNNIKLRNAEAYTAAQFDINLSDGQSISNVVLNVSSDHSLYWKMVDANTYRVVVYSMTNAAFRANSDNLFTVFMTGSQNATISNELLIKADGTTGIDAIRTEAENGNVYDLNGRQVKTPRKGVYIINGRKVVK